MNLSDIELTVLCEINKGDKSMREIAEYIGKSLGTVQTICRELEIENLIVNPYDNKTGENRKAKGRRVSGMGKALLRRANLL